MTLALERMDHRPLLPSGSEPPLSLGESPRGQLGRSEPTCPARLSSSSSCLVSANHRVMVCFFCCCCFHVLMYSTKVCSSENGIKDLIPFMQ